MIAAWPPASIASRQARKATRVLPEPTSPWRRRAMGRGEAMSAAISAAASTWPLVSSKGRRSMRRRLRRPWGARRSTWTSRRRMARRATAIWK